MLLRRLELHRFRNYDRACYEPGPGVNLIVGTNAQGKTSLLEAIYLLATSKSLRGSRDAEMIQWGSPCAVVRAEIDREEQGNVELEAALSVTERKALCVNTIRATRAMEFVGQLKAVCFTSTDLETVRGEPSRRRRFLDLEISQLSPAYCNALSLYRRALDQRNRLLKLGRDRFASGSVAELLDPWTEQVVRYGSRIVERRRLFLEALEPYARQAQEQLSGGEEGLHVGYVGPFECGGDEAQIAETFRSALAKVRDEELRRQVTLVGPHRDDVALSINGRDVRTYGSQGQQRSAVLSLKLGEIALMRETAGESPVCLLDDVFNELDSGRRKRLFDEMLTGSQVVLTATDVELAPPAVRAVAAVARIESGAIVDVRA